MYTVSWLSPDIAKYGSYFEFDFTSTNEVSGYFHLISDGELALADPMNGTRTSTNISTLSTKNVISTANYDNLIKEINEKHNESAASSIQSNIIDVKEKLEIKNNAFQNKPM